MSPPLTEWMMDGVWPDDITPEQGAGMLDYYAKLIGVDHVGLATDDLHTIEQVVPSATAHPDLFDDDGYMVDAFDRGAAGCAELSKFIPAVTDEMWKLG